MDAPQATTRQCSQQATSAQRRDVLRALLSVGIGASLMSRPIAAFCGSKELRVLTAPDPTTQRPVLQALKARFPGMVSDADPNAFDQVSRSGNSPIVAIGPAALRNALEADLHAPLVSIFTSSQIYRKLTNQFASHVPRSTVTGIFADASAQAQLQLMAALFEPRLPTVGVLLSDASVYFERPLRQAAAQMGIELVLARLQANQDPVRALNDLNGAQVLLALPDSTLYTPDILRSILESTYRRGMPVIGFSSATVMAGTLATAYADVDDVVADLADLLENLGNMGPGQSSIPLPDPRFPRYWHVAVNDNVARSLGITITSRVRALGVHPSGVQG